MALQAAVDHRIFHFTFEARTSRGPMPSRTSWFIKLWDEKDPERQGIGECAPLPGLSVDYRETMAEVLRHYAHAFIRQGDISSVDSVYSIIPGNLPSVRFAFEMAVRDWQQGGRRIIFDNAFIHGQRIPINGLIWMGEPDHMMRQADEKIARGFRTIKLKVGSLRFDDECAVLQYIRERYRHLPIELRLDANGALADDEAMDKLNVLKQFAIHSIEQPLKPGAAALEKLCRISPVPVALDEELIGVSSLQEKKELLERIKPHYIILKPSLHGGLQGCEEWISLAGKNSIGWWMTSALESNIGLNAICQFTAQYPVTLPQGLGTGLLYHNNFESPLTVSEGFVHYAPGAGWNLDDLFRH
jgi:o-succinylbenzoate synthase